ncbi:histidine phosphatase family protein [Sulfitobacter aestuarii]|uniref:Histidine phosphatase family protein n=1 Tax=Sulfitobacter aestuarii TaxID=2161676 RepID=A0ABW5U2S9_9RHOB
MSHITLIRHGQANSTAKDERSYDRLSALGHEQAAWLGAHLRDTQAEHVRLYTGTLRRHVETAEAMQTGLTPIRDARLNELEYFTLASLLEEQHGIPFPSEPTGFTHHLPQVFDYWKSDRFERPPESYLAFETRVQEVLHEIAEGDGPALVVTSGGLISMAMAQAMGLGTPAMARIALAIMHTSIHRLFPIGGHWAPVLFNAVPHLDRPDRRAAQTHI